MSWARPPDRRSPAGRPGRVGARSPDPDQDLADLYRALVPDARRFAYLLTGDHALAEDVSHEAFLRVAAKRSGLRDPGAVPAYLRRAVVNEVRARQRSLVRRSGREARVARVVPDPVTRGSIDHVDLRLDLLEALHRLPLRQRTAILLRYSMDLSDTQVAAAMDCPVGTVKSAVSRGLEALRKGGAWS